MGFFVLSKLWDVVSNFNYMERAEAKPASMSSDLNLCHNARNTQYTVDSSFLIFHSSFNLRPSYDPFGNIISGTLVGEYGFSTKPLVDDLDFYYYGFRYYDPVTGRWPSRDPASEFWGGTNLYAMVANQPVNYFDYLGLSASCGCDDDGNKIQKVTDDFGRECCEDLIETISYQYRLFSEGQYAHAQISLPDAKFGWGPVETGYGEFETQPGQVYDAGNLSESIDYRACSGSASAIRDSITNNSEGSYNYANIGAPNCVGWACQRLEDAGARPPIVPDLPFIMPEPWGMNGLGEMFLDNVSDVFIGGGSGNSGDAFGNAVGELRESSGLLF